MFEISYNIHFAMFIWKTKRKDRYVKYIINNIQNYKLKKVNLNPKRKQELITWIFNKVYLSYQITNVEFTGIVWVNKRMKHISISLIFKGIRITDKQVFRTYLHYKDFLL